MAISEPNDEFVDEATKQLFDLLITEAEENSRNKKIKKQASKINAAKRDSLPDEMFNYIHTARCRRLFSLSWYDDETYVSASTALPNPCCNGPSCNSEDPEFLKRSSLVNHFPPNNSEFDRELIVLG